MCRLCALVSSDYFSPMETILALETMKEGHDGSGLGLIMRNLGGEFEGLKEYPILSAIARASSRVLAIPLSGCGIPSFFIFWRKRSRSSASSIVSTEVPMIFTPASSNSAAMFNGVCPPNWHMMPSGFSFS